jgi:mono/diheme cytochrome c family protein
MRLGVGILIVIAAFTAGCGQNMEDQPKYAQYEPAGLFRNGRVLQQAVAGTVARGDLARDAEAATKPTLDRALLVRGRHAHDVFCAPCHARTGDGDGMIVRRGMPRPPSYHDERLRSATDQHLFDVITNGVGVMFAHGDRIPPRDRWAIVAYVRALQLSQNATLDDVPESERKRLIDGKHK